MDASVRRAPGQLGRSALLMTMVGEMTEQERLLRALLDVISIGDTGSIRRLVEKGANLRHRDQWRRTPLILAALSGINGAAVSTLR